VNCPGCGAEHRPGGRFCAHCGAALDASCPSCGEPTGPGDRFCSACGTTLEAPGAATARVAAATGPAVSERRLVSILFADLVGFTTMSEHRDPEQVRDLLSRYFDRCRTLIERHGGTVEKFIGDAVMAVWGSPVAREDDAERAVRAALALTQAVTALGAEVGIPALRVRAGVLTGPAAVELGVGGEGMVLGDTVNTASRLQSIAEPGTVLVDDVTRRATEAAIAYEDAGTLHVKGRDQPIRAWTALRVVAGVGGQGRAAGLEAPFVGRDDALDLVIEAAEGSRRARRAELVLVLGDAGTGKSRLGWEFEKHSDGIAEEVLWHRGRCLSYGEGIAYWALAEMVRGRAGIHEEEDAAQARPKLRAAVERFVADDRDRRLVEPRLAHLLGLEERTSPDRADLFSGWRLFLERMAADSPVVLVFEDLHWADSGLLDFLDYLLEWSADYPIFVLALARTELTESWPARAPAVTLGPLPDGAMRDLLSGLVPGLPDDAAARILERAEGIPLYAIETVRMLLDRGLVTQDGARYLVTGAIGDLEVPETLHALVASRLDSLSAGERAVLQDAAVIGQSFTASGVAALGARTVADTERILDGLVAKQVVSRDHDPKSPERGQYGFLQALLRTIAYGTLSRRDRKARHLAAARHLQEAWGEDAGDIAELLAAHFLDAADADPDAADAGRIRELACETLAQAGRRALSLALGPEAQRAFDRAATLAVDDATRAELLELAGRAAWLEADSAGARRRLDAAMELYEAQGRPDATARAMVVIADVLMTGDRLDEAIAVAERAVTGLADRDPERAAAMSQLARLYSATADMGRAMEVSEAALVLAEPLQDWETIADALSTRAMTLMARQRHQEGRALLDRALELGLRHDLTTVALRSYNNLGWAAMISDRFSEALEYLDRCAALARSRGDRMWIGRAENSRIPFVTLLGQWDKSTAGAERVLASAELTPESVDVLLYQAMIQAARGDAEGLGRTLELGLPHVDSVDAQTQQSARLLVAVADHAGGRHRAALEQGKAIAEHGHLSARREAYVIATDAALAAGDEDAFAELVALVDAAPPAASSPVLRAEAARLSSALAVRRGDVERAAGLLQTAERLLREVETPFLLAQVLVEHAELLAGDDRAGEALVLAGEAREIFAGLRATPWLERAVRALAPLEQAR
jgi:class 3 adenylate cyclase/tetratricopeptide (TPR) repeat protein